jgi:hypothetical protein
MPPNTSNIFLHFLIFGRTEEAIQAFDNTLHLYQLEYLARLTRLALLDYQGAVAFRIDTLYVPVRMERARRAAILGDAACSWTDMVGARKCISIYLTTIHLMNTHRELLTAARLVHKKLAKWQSDGKGRISCIYLFTQAFRHQDTLTKQSCFPSFSSKSISNHTYSSSACTIFSPCLLHPPFS